MTGTMSLPAPVGAIKALALGQGHQNYTCNATTPAPVPIGAKATLTDASPLLPFMPAGMGEKFLNDLPTIAYKIEAIIDIINNALSINLDVIGQHIFNALGTPCFDLGDLGQLEAKKLPGGDIVAPAGSVAGSVDWLALEDAGGSVGLSRVYRVNTAGGKPSPTCDGTDNLITVPYAALYVFYGDS